MYKDKQYIMKKTLFMKMTQVISLYVSNTTAKK